MLYLTMDLTQTTLNYSIDTTKPYSRILHIDIISFLCQMILREK